MGAYLNSQTPYTLYQSESRSPYFVVLIQVNFLTGLKFQKRMTARNTKTSITSFGLISVKCRETVNLTDSISSVWKNF